MKCKTRVWLVDSGATSHITPYSLDLARSKTSTLSFRVVGSGTVSSSREGEIVLLMPATPSDPKSGDHRQLLKPRIITRVFCIPTHHEPILSLPALRRDMMDVDLQENILFSTSDPSIRVPLIYKHGLPYVRLAVTTDNTCYSRAFAATPVASVVEDALSRIIDAFGPYDLVSLPPDCAKSTFQTDRWTSRSVLIIPPPEDQGLIYEAVLKALREFSSYKPLDTRITMLIPIRPQAKYHAHLSRFHRAAVYSTEDLFRDTSNASATWEDPFPGLKFGLYYKDIRTQGHLSPTMLLHLRLGHPSATIMERVLQNMKDPEKETGLPGHMPKHNLRHAEMCDCVICMVANQRRPRGLGPHVDTHNPEAPFQVCGLDIHGPLVKSPEGFEYAIIIVCYYTRWVYFHALRSKGDAGHVFMSFTQWVKKQEWSKQLPSTSASCSVKVIQVLKSDNAKEFIGPSSMLGRACEQLGVLQYRASEYCHEQMGMVEKRWSPLASKSRSMLLTASMPSDMWPHSYKHAAYLENRLPKKALDWKSPYETLYGRAPVFHHLLTFGSPCSLILGDTGQASNKPKTAPRAVGNLLWVGHADNSNSALLLDMKDRRTVRRGGMFRSAEISGLPNLGRMSNPWEFDKFAPLSSEFTVTRLHRPLVDSLNEASPPAILGHQAYRAETVDGCFQMQAVLHVKPADDAGEEDSSVFITVSDFIEKGSAGTPAVRLAAYTKYIAQHLADNPLNEYFPLFAQCSVSREQPSDAATVWETGAVTAFTYSPTQPADQQDTKFDVVSYTTVDTLKFLDLSQINLDNSTSDPAMPAIMAARATAIPGVTEVETMTDVLRAPDAPEWIHVIHIEVHTLEKMGTFDLKIPCPRGVNPVEVTLKFKVKFKADGSLDKRKARLVARGFKQIYLKSYTDTFAPASQLDSLRLLVSYAAQYKLNISSIDVVGAFLNAKLKEDIWIKFPHDLPMPALRGRTAKLKKSLYGLKQAAHDWWKLLRGLLSEGMGLDIRENSKDPCLYHLFSDHLIVIILVHVDDCIIAYSNDKFINAFRKKIEEKYEITFNLKPDQLLGIQIEHFPNRGGFRLTNTRLIDEIVRTYGLEKANPTKIPMDPGTDLVPGVSPPANPKLPFLSINGSLTWVCRCTRPDIAVPTNMLAQFSNSFDPTHMKGSIGVALALKGTRLVGLVYVHTAHVPRDVTRLSLYTDSDYAVCKVTRRSRTGWVLFMGTNVISYCSSRQHIVTLSSTESELVAMCDGVKNLLGTIQIVQDFVPAELPVAVHVDNQGTIAIGTNEVHNSRTKHIDVRYFFTRELVDDKTVDIVYINTKDNPADPLTKLLPYPAYKEGMEKLSLSSPTSSSSSKLRITN